jgi:dTDP-L-rhamnose 4-epimerase
VKVLVTGGAGFIGSHTVDRLIARGHQVTVLDILDRQVHQTPEPVHIAGHVRSGTVSFVQGDVTDRRTVERCLEEVEAVIHLAAVVGVGQSMYQPLYYVHHNDCGTGTLLDLLVERKDKIRKVVVASSMSLYGEGAYRCPSCGGDVPRERTDEQLRAHDWEVACAGCGTAMQPRGTPETKPADLASIYAATKKHQEDLCVCFGRAYGIPTFALRFFNVVGPRQSLGNPYTGVAAIFLSRLLNGNPPLIFEDGKQSRDFIDVRDVARVVVMSLEHAGPGTHVLNIGTGRSMTVGEVARAIAAQLGSPIAPEILGKYRVGDVRHCFADVTRAREVLGFTAEHTFEAGLPGLIEWCRGVSAVDRAQQSLDELRSKGLVV